MTCARQSRRHRREREQLVAERNALLDVLNVILRKAGNELAIADSWALGTKRCVVSVESLPGHLLIKRDPEQLVAEAGHRLIVLPERPADA